MSAVRAGSKKLNGKALCSCQTFDALMKVTMSNATTRPALGLGRNIRIEGIGAFLGARQVFEQPI
jgi:hypothetical protein